MVKTCSIYKLERQIGRNRHFFICLNTRIVAVVIYLNQYNKNEGWCEGVTGHQPDP